MKRIAPTPETEHVSDRETRAESTLVTLRNDIAKPAAERIVEKVGEDEPNDQADGKCPQLGDACEAHPSRDRGQ